MSLVKITIKLNKKNSAKVKLKLDILPVVPKLTESTKNSEQLSLFEPVEDIPINTPEKPSSGKYNIRGLWRKIHSHLNSYRFKK